MSRDGRLLVRAALLLSPAALTVAAAQTSIARATTFEAARTTRTAHFRSPTGNINCRLAATSATCLVRRNTWRKKPARPPSCDVDWFPAEISLFRRTLTIGACRGDVGPACVTGAVPPCTTLSYGRSISIGVIRCSSATNGVTCRRRDARRIGFRIAREGYTLYR